MKRIAAIAAAIAMMLMSASFASAQDSKKSNDSWQSRMKAEKIAYLTDAMDLTSAEAEKFWPIYNKCEAEKRNAFNSICETYKALSEAIEAGKSDKEINALLDKYTAAQETEKSIDKKYIAQYRKILSGKKVAQLYIGEESFRRQQIHRLRKDEGKDDRH